MFLRTRLPSAAQTRKYEKASRAAEGSENRGKTKIQNNKHQTSNKVPDTKSREKDFEIVILNL
jgi:hypothetical protein